ncbi:hypothetical protein H0H93_013524 [Arthromyces matolae]|nr:hypothetical protein H0H93_013524 [Arthromyces matolae]
MELCLRDPLVCLKVNHESQNAREELAQTISDQIDFDGCRMAEQLWLPLVCESTITYMLSGEVGLLADLGLLAQVAALARESQPGPQPGCKPPPPEELVACPRLARHWVVNSRTAKFHLGHEYSDAYEDPYAHELNRLKPMFTFSETSFQKTIQLNEYNTRLVKTARSELSSLTSPDGSAFDLYIALHLRRGDRKPAFYRGAHVPTEKFIQAATTSFSRLSPDKSQADLILFVASDSANALKEVADLTAARYTTFSLPQSANAELRSLASPSEYIQKDFNLLGLEAKIRATRGMIVDFALLSGLWAKEGDSLPTAVVCTFSSNVCKLAAVGLGWSSSFGKVDAMGSIDNSRKRWIEIDQNGAIVPAWLPFELF